MNIDKDTLESLLIDYIDGKLNAVDKHKIEQELMRNASTYKVYEELKTVIQAMNHAAPLVPSDRLRATFNRRLEEERAALPAQRSVVLRPWVFKIAAAILVVVLSASVIYLGHRNQKQQEALSKIQAEHEQLLKMISDPSSAAQRIRGVQASLKTANPDQQLTLALLKALNHDPNANVRLAAIDGLRRFYHEETVREGLLNTLETQTDPVVQVVLIQLLVEMKEKAAIQSLQRIVDQPEIIPTVKDEAHVALLRLS